MMKKVFVFMFLVLTVGVVQGQKNDKWLRLADSCLKAGDCGCAQGAYDTYRDLKGGRDKQIERRIAECENDSENDNNTFVVVLSNADYPMYDVENAQYKTQIDCNSIFYYGWVDSHGEQHWFDGDGERFVKTCQETLGVSESHIHLYKNATSSDFKSCLNRLKRASSAYNGKIKVILYYIGDAVKIDGELVLLPVDSTVRMSYDMTRFLYDLFEINTLQTICFIDAPRHIWCGDVHWELYGGTPDLREKQLQELGKYSSAHKEQKKSDGTWVVITSCGEYSCWWDEGEGFNYYLIKKIQDTNGKVSFGELYDYLSVYVKRAAYDHCGYVDEPRVLFSPKLSNNWRRIKL